jgi:aminoglycoside 2'-N-acetyltransferase I
MRTDVMPADVLADVRAVVDAAFGPRFSQDDWQHALGGWHVLVRRAGVIVAHAAVVPRELVAGGAPFNTGYLEAVATDPRYQRTGLGSLAMREVTTVLHREFDLGALSTGAHRFYEQLGWERWRGSTYVRGDGADVRTPDEDEGVMVLRFGPSAALDLTVALSCEPREGDDW